MHRVLITGATGFLGRHLTEHLLEKTEYHIISLARSKKNIFKSDRVTNIVHDLRDPMDHLAAKVGNVDYVVHLAAATCTRKSITDPIAFVMDNVVGTANLLEYVRHNSKNIKQFLYFSTAEVFGDGPSEVSFKENDKFSPNTPYAVTKVAAQNLCMSYNNIYNIPAIVVFAMNVFGAHQPPEKFIPLVIKKISEEEKVHVFLNPDGTAPHRRNYLHVTDLCDVMLFLFKHGVAGEMYNVGTKSESDNLKIVQNIAKILNKELYYELVEKDSDFLSLPKLNVSKVHKMGWRQKISLESGLKQLIGKKKNE